MVGSEDGGSILHGNFRVSTQTHTRPHRSNMIEKFPAVKTCKPKFYQLELLGHESGKVAGGQQTVHSEEHHDFVTPSETVNDDQMQRGGGTEDM